MAIQLTNITNSYCNVPDNRKVKTPKYTVPPNSAVTIPDEYLAGLDAEAQARFLRVTTGDSPLFRIEQADKKAAKKASKKFVDDSGADTKQKFEEVINEPSSVQEPVPGVQDLPGSVPPVVP